jgi:hypothetical protein
MTWRALLAILYLKEAAGEGSNVDAATMAISLAAGNRLARGIWQGGPHRRLLLRAYV